MSKTWEALPILFTTRYSCSMLLPWRWHQSKLWIFGRRLFSSDFLLILTAASVILLCCLGSSQVWMSVVKTLMHAQAQNHDQNFRLFSIRSAPVYDRNKYYFLINLKLSKIQDKSVLWWLFLILRPKQSFCPVWGHDRCGWVWWKHWHMYSGYFWWPMYQQQRIICLRLSRRVQYDRTSPGLHR